MLNSEPAPYPPVPINLLDDRRSVEDCVGKGEIALINGPTGSYYETQHHIYALDILRDFIVRKDIDPRRIILVNIDDHQDVVSSYHHGLHPPDSSDWINAAQAEGLYNNNDRSGYSDTGAGVIWFARIDHDPSSETVKEPFHMYLPYRSSDVNLTAIDFGKIELSDEASQLLIALLSAKDQGYILAVSIDFDAGAGVRTLPTDCDLSNERWLVSLRRSADLVMSFRSPGFTKLGYARSQSLNFVNQHVNGYLE